MMEALVLQMGMTNYEPFHSYAVRTFRYVLYTVITHVSYANSVLYVGSVRTMWRHCRPMWSDVVISRTAFRQCIFYRNYWKKFQYCSYKQICHVVHR